MNKKMTQKLMVALAITTIIALPLTAKSVRQKITAYLNPHITYTLDGQDVLKGSQTITYNNQNYVSVSELAKALGKEVSFNNGVVNITTSEVDQDSSDIENGVIENAIIKEIDIKNKNLTVLPQGQSDKFENYIIIHVPYQDKVFNERIKSIIHFEDLEVGMTLKIIHEPLMTASLPAQTTAYKIIVLQENNGVTPPVVDQDDYDDEIDDAKITAIDHSQKTLTVENEDGIFTVTFTNKTKVKFDDKKNKNPNVNSLKVNQVVDIEIEDGLVKSIEID